jgi:uncharacterized damage-inducible protein DinB
VNYGTSGRYRKCEFSLRDERQPSYDPVPSGFAVSFSLEDCTLRPMPTAPPASAELALLIRLFDEAYSRKAWHGPNLRGSVRGVSAEEAAWRPAPNRHCIAEIVVHAAYWKYAVRRQLTGAERGSFPLKGSNWFPVDKPFDAAKWSAYVRLLDDEHRALRATVLAVAPGDLHKSPPTSKYTRLALVQGITAHDVYHAGQIQLLKRLGRG